MEAPEYLEASGDWDQWQAGSAAVHSADSQNSGEVSSANFVQEGWCQSGEQANGHVGEGVMRRLSALR